MNLVWLRNDLRLEDNPALWHALEQGGPVMVVYCDCEPQDRNHGESRKKIAFRRAHAEDLANKLRQQGIKFQMLEGLNYHTLPSQIQKFWKTHKVTKLYFNENYLLNERLRDQHVINSAKNDQLVVHTYPANYLVPPGSVRKQDGSMYHVFTPYKKKMVSQLLVNPGKSYPVHGKVKIPNHSKLNNETKAIWPVGEQAAFHALQQFTQNGDYDRYRDRPDVAGTSQLSPYLAIGAISAQQCLQFWISLFGSEAIESKWVSELMWRDFYSDLCFEYPKLVKGQPFKRQAVDDWQNNMDYFGAWKAGQTGFPIIDAGMRQMLTTGWMHNRVRMLVASFLTKLCLVDWRMGEKVFMEHLIDGDFASNNGGWQWSSATGCDAAPYFRVFNPWTQSKKFDPEGAYIKKYVPELQSLSAKDIHEPSAQQRMDCDYVQTIFNYKERREMCLSWYKSKKN